MDDFGGVILAGGKGNRLRPLTDNIPKSLIEIKGKRLIDYSIQILQEFGVLNIMTAISQPEVFREKYSFPLVKTEGEENVFYIFCKCIENVTNAYAVFVDGDSVYEKSILGTKKELNLDFDLLVGLSTNSLSRSMWTYQTRNDFAVDILQTPSLPHYCHIVKTESARQLIVKLAQMYRLGEHKYENQLFPQYERYYLGWGLLAKLFIDYGYKVRVSYTNCHFMNVNSPYDLSLCRGIDITGDNIWL